MVTPATARAGPSIGPFAAQHGGNARIVSVLRFQLAPGGGPEGKSERHPQGQAHAEVAGRHPDRGSHRNSYRKSAIDHRERSRAYLP